ncbi:hypothetical protein KEJ13_08715 [Candidatus Bathyarchaeota archaeon]|nr:hypothetical protein [Candidatus Bathyarchaeota archaeon]
MSKILVKTQELNSRLKINSSKQMNMEIQHRNKKRDYLDQAQTPRSKQYISQNLLRKDLKKLSSPIFIARLFII